MKLLICFLWLFTSLTQASDLQLIPVCNVDNTGTTDVTNEINNCVYKNKLISLRAGSYSVSGPITVGSDIFLGGGIVGAGAEQTIITNSNPVGDTVNYSNASHYVKLEGFTVTRSVVATSGCGVNAAVGGTVGMSTIEHVNARNNWDGFCLGGTDDSQLVFNQAENNYHNGFYFENSAKTTMLQWVLDRTVSDKNNGWGYYVNGVSTALSDSDGNTTVGTYLSTLAFANSEGGYAFVATPPTVINGLTMSNIGSSSNGYDGLVLITNGGTDIQINGGLIELSGQTYTGRNMETPPSNIGCGIDTSNSIIKELTIQTVNISGNSFHGICIQPFAGNQAEISVLGSRIKSNGRQSPGNYSGISNASTSKIMAFGNFIEDGCTGSFKNGSSGVFNEGTNCP